jgi:hypothetical protein
MSKATDPEIKDLISGIDRKVDLLAQEVSSIKNTVEKMDNRLWAFGGLILAACLAAFLKALNL